MKKIYLFITCLYICLILLLLTGVPNDKKSADLYVLLLFFVGLLMYTYWWLYKDYSRKIDLLSKSNIIEFFKSQEFHIQEKFTGWEHSVVILGSYNDFFIQIDLLYNKGLVFNKYYFVASAFIQKLSGGKQLKEERKRLGKKLRSQNIDLFDGQANHRKEIQLINSSNVENDIKTILNSLTRELITNDVLPMKIESLT